MAYRPKTCGRCGTTYCAETWAALELAGTMSRRDVESLVLGWRESAVIDLRRCGRCSTILARLVDPLREAVAAASDAAYTAAPHPTGESTADASDDSS